MAKSQMGCTLQKSLEKRTANIPGPKPLPGTEQLAPYVVVADVAFLVREYLTQEQHVFNYRWVCNYG